MKTFFKYLLAAAYLCGVVACEEEKERPQDAPPSRSATIFFVVTDADTGEDLLDPEVENCLLEDVRITYDGNVYRYDMERGVGIYTATLERFIMRWGHYTKRRPDDPYCLSIGKFDCDPERRRRCSSDLPGITPKPLIWRRTEYRRSLRLWMKITIPYWAGTSRPSATLTIAGSSC